MNEPRSLLEHLSFLQVLPSALRALVLDSFLPVSFPYGSTIVQEGQEADGLYVLTAGQAQVVKQDQNGREMTLRILRPGDCFGEIAFLQNDKRSATVRACDNVQTFRLDKSMFSALLRKSPELRGHLDRHVKRIALQDFLRLHSPFSRMPVEALTIMIDDLQVITVENGQVIIQQGDEPGPMYIVQQGECRVFAQKDGCRQYLNDLQVGDTFGEVSIVTGTKRNASVEAVSSCTLLRVSPEAVLKLIGKFPDFKHQMEINMCWHGWMPI